MSFIFDGIILASAIIAIVVGAKRGFIKSIMGMATIVTALFVAFAFTPTLSAQIEKTPVVQDVSESISDTIKSLSHDGESNLYDLAKLFDDMPDAFKQILDRYGAEENQLKDTVTPSDTALEPDVNNLSEAIADPVVKALSGVIAFLLLFVGSVIVLKIVTWLLDLIFQLPVLKTANTLLGFIVGLVSALVLAWTLSSLSVIFIRAMSSISPQYFSEDLIKSTIIIRFFASDGISNFLKNVIG